MTRIICRASECVYYEDGICGSEEIEYDPDAGCLTFEDVADLPPEEEEPFDWGEESNGDLFDEEDEEEEEEEEDSAWKEDEEDNWQDDWEEEGAR